MTNAPPTTPEPPPAPPAPKATQRPAGYRRFAGSVRRICVAAVRKARSLLPGAGIAAKALIAVAEAATTRMVRSGGPPRLVRGTEDVG